MNGSRVKLSAVAVLGPALLAGCYLQQGGWLELSPAYRERHLLGLTPDEVVRRLGKPDFDPRYPPGWKPGEPPYWQDEAKDGPLHLGYAQGWNRCVIRFEGGRVSSVGFVWK